MNFTASAAFEGVKTAAPCLFVEVLKAVNSYTARVFLLRANLKAHVGIGPTTISFKAGYRAVTSPNTLAKEDKELPLLLELRDADDMIIFVLSVLMFLLLQAGEHITEC